MKRFTDAGKEASRLVIYEQNTTIKLLDSTVDYKSLCLTEPNRMLLVKFCAKLPKWQSKGMAIPTNSQIFM
jgi:hypothetical protein